MNRSKGPVLAMEWQTFLLGFTHLTITEKAMSIKPLIKSTRYLLTLIAIIVTIQPVHPAAAISSADISQPQACGAATADLISPAHGITLTRLNPTFTFQPVSGISEYRLDVSTKPDFSPFEPTKSERGYQFSISGSTADTFTYTSASAQNFLPDTLYYWRVAPVCSGVNGPYSDVFSFQTPESVTLPDAPVSLMPVDGFTTATSGVTFTWGWVNGANTYLLRLYQYESDALADTQYLSRR